MIDKKQFIESQKECADMLGMTLEEYNNYLKNVKINTNVKKSDEDFFKKLGLENKKIRLKKDVKSE